MSGITGIFHRDGTRADPAHLGSMMDAIAHRGRDGEDSWLSGQVGLGCQLLKVTPESADEIQPFVSRQGHAIVFDGRLDNRQELLGLAGPDAGVDRQSPDVSLIAALYRKFGEDSVSKLVGDFALALFDVGKKQLLLARDPIGVRPLYYHRFGETVLFGSEVKSILAHPDVTPRPDKAHLAELILGAPPADDGGLTFFDGISSLAPGHLLLAEKGRVRTQKFWEFDPSRSIRLGSYGEYVEAFRHYLETALRRRMRTRFPVALSLSGGLDSSSLFCLMESIHRTGTSSVPSVNACSYIFPEGCAADETSHIAELERHLGVQTRRVPLSRISILDGGRDSVRCTETPIPESMWSTGQAMLVSAAEAGSRVLISGHWADQVLYDTSYLVDLFRAFRFRELRAHVREYPNWFTDEDAGAFRRGVRRTIARACVPRFMIPPLRKMRYRMNRFQRNRPWYTDSFRLAGSGAPPAFDRRTSSNHARALYDTVRSRFYVLAMASTDKVAAHHGMVRAYPFLDRELVAFLMAIPGEVTAHGGVPKGLLRDAVRDLLPKGIAGRNWKADTTALEIDSMREEFSRIGEFLTGDTAAARAGYVDPAIVRAELSKGREQFKGSNLAVAWSMEYLVGLELWLGAFFSDRHSC